MKNKNWKTLLSDGASILGGILSFILIYSLFKDIYDDVTNKKKFNELIKSVNEINQKINLNSKK